MLWRWEDCQGGNGGERVNKLRWCELFMSCSRVGFMVLAGNLRKMYNNLNRVKFLTLKITQKKILILSLQTQVKETAELFVRFSDENYFTLKEIESKKDEIKSLQIENQDLKSRESELNNLEKVYETKESVLLKDVDQMKCQVSKLVEKLQILDQEMKQQIILFEEDKRMFLAKNEFLEKVSSSVQKEYNDLLASDDFLKQRLETKFKFLKHDNSLEKTVEMIEQEYESNVSKISITSSTTETKNWELIKEMGDKVKRFDDEKNVFENKTSKLEKDLAQRVKDFDDVKTKLSRRTDKFETFSSWFFTDILSKGIILVYVDGVAQCDLVTLKILLGSSRTEIDLARSLPSNLGKLGDNENNVVNKIPILLNVENAPKTYKEAITSRKFAFWKEAIDDEMDFIIKDLNEVDTILGIKVKRHNGGYALNQCHYIDKIIDKFWHLNIEKANTPYESSCNLVENDGRVVAQIEYASTIGYNDAPCKTWYGSDGHCHALDIKGRQINDENDDENVHLYYHINKYFGIPFGREEFCLVTGLRFGVQNWAEYDTKERIPFRQRVFLSYLDWKPITGIDIANMIVDHSFAQLYDNDVVSLYCLGILQLVILGVESRRVVPDWMLRLANDRVAWNKYPWGSYVWPTLYFQLRNENVKRWLPLYVVEPTNEDDVKTYSIFGYTWAFKTWILESFRVTTIRYFDRYNQYPRVAAWIKKKRRQEMNVHPVQQENKEPIIVEQHYELSDFSQFQSMQNIPNRGKREQFPSKYKLASFMKQPPTTILPKQRVNKTKNKGKKANLSPLNLRGAFEDDNVEENNVTFLGSQFTSNLLIYENVDPIKMELLIRRRNAKANWTVAYTGTISVHPKNNRFIIPTDQHVIGTLDGTTRPYPAWNDVDWVFMPIHVAENHWATDVIHLPNSHFYVIDSMSNEQNKDVLS
nr:phospholipase-like protein [Tanacetum cinerariifolium]